MQALRAGHARVCVATDVAARGLDLPDLGLVIHAEVPVNVESLLHRSGRTGRAGRKGVSVVLAPRARRRKAELLFQSASIRAEWSGPPTADEIREKDRQRMLEDPVLVSPPDEEFMEEGRRLLERLSPEQVAGALMRLYREKSPPPEDVQDDAPPGAGRPQGLRVSRPPSEPVESEWFRIDIGRKDRADPKWLIPKICRAGGVTKRDIGFIRVLEAETRFEITRDAATGFAAAVASPLPDGTRISRSEAPVREERPSRSGSATPFVKAAVPAPLRPAKPFKAPSASRGPRPADAAGDRPWKGKPRQSAPGATARPPAKRRPNDRPARKGPPARGKPRPT